VTVSSREDIDTQLDWLISAAIEEQAFVDETKRKEGDPLAIGESEIVFRLKNLKKFIKEV
jgi:hypothetical protein